MNTIPLYIGLLIFAVLSIGFIIDIILAAVYWGKLPRFGKDNLIAVPWVFVDVLRICLAVFIIYWLMVFIEYFLLKINIIAKQDLERISTVINTAGVYALVVWFILSFLKRRYGVGLYALGIRWYLSLKNSFKGIAFYAGFLPIMFVISIIGLLICNIFGIVPEPHELVEILEKDQPAWYVFYLIFTAVIAAPVFEEILFRGLIYQGIKKHLGIFKAMLVTSVLFSFLHFNFAQFLPVVGLGMLLCLIFEYSASLIPAIVIHIINNGIFLGLFFVLKDNL